MNKYVFRRAVAGIVITPLVALGWLVFYAMLVGLGAGASATPSEVFGNGLVLGVFASVWFALDAWRKR